MSRKRIFYIVFFSLLVLVFFVALGYVIPGFRNQRMNPVSVVQPWTFVNQDGEPTTESIARGKVTAVNYFFTTCPVVCPKMMGNLKPVYEAFKDDKDFLMLSFTSDPEVDSVPILKRFADSLSVNTDKWVFLTGRKDSLYNTARHSYRIDDPKNFVTRIEDDFLHTQFIALVNKKGEVVKIYDGIKPSEMSEMEAEIKKLLKE